MAKTTTKNDSWYVYIIECENGQLYTGITTDLERRFEQHRTGLGAKFFRTTKPINIGYFECISDRGQALSREAAIKKLKPAKKQELIDQFSQD